MSIALALKICSLAFVLTVCTVHANSLTARRSGNGQQKDFDEYFQYFNVLGPSEYEYGYKRGQQGQFVARGEQLKDSHFRTRVIWADEDGIYGEQIWDYNHGTTAPPPTTPPLMHYRLSPPAFSPPFTSASTGASTGTSTAASAAALSSKLRPLTRKRMKSNSETIQSTTANKS